MYQVMCTCIEGLLQTMFYLTSHVSPGKHLLVLSGMLLHSCLKNIYTLGFTFTIHMYYIYVYINTHTHIYTCKVHVYKGLPCIKMTKHLLYFRSNSLWNKITYWSALMDKLLTTVYFYSDKKSILKITTASTVKTI